MNQRGVTYIEAIAAVAMIAFAVLAATSLSAVHPVASSRLDAQDDMLRALDSLLEGVRAGTVPLQSGSVASPIPAKTQVRLSIEIAASDLPGLIRVRAIARARVRAEVLERSMSTAVWRP